MKFEPLYHFPFKKLVFGYYLSFIWNRLVFILTPLFMDDRRTQCLYIFITCFKAILQYTGYVPKMYPSPHISQHHSNVTITKNCFLFLLKH